MVGIGGNHFSLLLKMSRPSLSSSSLLSPPRGKPGGDAARGGEPCVCLTDEIPAA